MQNKLRLIFVKSDYLSFTHKKFHLSRDMNKSDKTNLGEKNSVEQNFKTIFILNA